MALTDKLTAIANAIRSKTGKTETMTLDQMPVEIESIGGNLVSIPDEYFEITGDCSYKFAFSNYILFDSLLNRFTYTAPTDFSYMFNGYPNSELPTDIVTNKNTNIYMGGMFSNSKITKAPKIVAIPSNVSSMYANCKQLQDVSNFKYLDFSYINTHSASIGGVFTNCTSLRKIPDGVLDNFYSGGTYSSNSPYYQTFWSCCTLGEIEGIAVQPTVLTSNRFYDTFRYCAMLKKITFKTNDDGSPIVAKWKNQTISIGGSVGYASDYDSSMWTSIPESGVTEQHNIMKYSDGTKIYGIENIKKRYDELKNDPNWFAGQSSNTSIDGKSIPMQRAFSKFNHDSIVMLINSLPDTSEYLSTAGGTNTIYLYKRDAIYTDEGGPTNLTEEEIAVATAKGWTISISDN